MFRGLFLFTKGKYAFSEAQFNDISEVIPKNLKTIGDNSFRYSFWKEDRAIPVNTNQSYDVLLTLRKVHTENITKNRKQMIKLPNTIEENSLINYELVDI